MHKVDVQWLAAGTPTGDCVNAKGVVRVDGIGDGQHKADVPEEVKDAARMVPPVDLHYLRAKEAKNEQGTN